MFTLILQFSTRLCSMILVLKVTNLLKHYDRLHEAIWLHIDTNWLHQQTKYQYNSEINNITIPVWISSIITIIGSRKQRTIVVWQIGNHWCICNWLLNSICNSVINCVRLAIIQHIYYISGYTGHHTSIIIV